jgi:hypothetical protein
MSAAASIEDRLAIRELQDRYSDAVFRNDAAAYAAGWTEDAHWEIVGNIIQLWQRLMVDMDTVFL